MDLCSNQLHSYSNMLSYLTYNLYIIMLVVVFIYLFIYFSIYLSTYSWYAINYNFMHYFNFQTCAWWFHYPGRLFQVEISN